MNKQRMCSIPDCGLVHYGHGYCSKHYTRWRRYGDPSTVRRARRSYPDVATRIARRSKPVGDCLVFTGGYAQRSGHKQIYHGGQMQRVHRLAYELAHGPVPPGMVVMHRCDNPPCVRLEHLTLGTIADNNEDRDRKGRYRTLRGSQNGNARLAEWQVAEIKARLASGEPQAALARRYGTSQSNISLISQGRAWVQVEAASWEAA